MKRFFKGLLKFLLVVYILACIGLYFGQEFILFRPSPLSPYETFRSGQELFLRMEDGANLHCIHLTEEKSKGVVLYLHGNRGNNRHCFHQALNQLGVGYDIFMPDYRGYGKSTGRISSQKQLFNDIETIYDHLLTQYEPEEIKVLGYSIGSGPASYIAAQRNPSELILCAPYKSILHLKNQQAPIIPSFIVKYPFRNDQHIKQTTCPVTLIHGEADQVIDHENSLLLQKIDPERVKLISMPGVSHRRTIFQDAVRQAIKD